VVRGPFDSTRIPLVFGMFGFTFIYEKKRKTVSAFFIVSGANLRGELCLYGGRFVFLCALDANVGEPLGLGKQGYMLRRFFSLLFQAV
jgi:hypothetical protein